METNRTTEAQLPVSRKLMVAQSIINLLLPLFFLMFPVFWSVDQYYANAAAHPDYGDAFWNRLRNLASETEPRTHFECAMEDDRDAFELRECRLRNLRVGYLTGRSQGPEAWWPIKKWICRAKLPLFDVGCEMIWAYNDTEDLDRFCGNTQSYCLEQNRLRAAGATLQPPVAIYDDARRLLRQWADRLEIAAKDYEKIRPIFWIVMFGWALLQVLALVGTVVMTRKAHLMVQASKARSKSAGANAGDG